MSAEKTAAFKADAIKLAFELPMPSETRDAEEAAVAYFLALPASETDLFGFNWNDLAVAARKVAFAFRRQGSRDAAERAESVATALMTAAKM